jgi:hypothetical protein
MDVRRVRHPGSMPDKRAFVRDASRNFLATRFVYTPCAFVFRCGGDTRRGKAFASQCAAETPSGDTFRQKVLRYQQTARLERFRSVPRTCRPPCGRVDERKTDRMVGRQRR